MPFSAPVADTAPKVWTFTPLAEARLRYERRQDKDFNSSVGDNRWDINQRYRAGIDATLGKAVKVRLLYQFAQNDGDMRTTRHSRVSYRDLLEGFAQFNFSSGTAVIGRQRVQKGEARLIGPSDWGVTPRAWDAARLTFGGWDAFLGRLAVGTTTNHDLTLAYLAKKHGSGESMVIQKLDTRPALDTRIYTINHRNLFKFGAADMTAEGSFQLGETGGVDVEAFAATVRAKFGGKAKVNPFVEVNVASGGSTSTKVKTFDNLFPTNHFYYGQADMQGLRNLVHFSVGADYQATKDTKYRVELNSFYLYDAEDGWYGAGGAINRGASGVVFRDPTGASGKTIGNEIGFYSTTTTDKRTTLMYGVSYFLPGGFIKSPVFNGGANQKDQIWGFVQLGWKY